MPTKADFLIIEVWLSFVSHLGQTIYAAHYRMAAAPQWLLNAEVVPIIVRFSMLAAVLHVAATGPVDGEEPRHSRIRPSAGVTVLIVGAGLANRHGIGSAIERPQP